MTTTSHIEPVSGRAHTSHRLLARIAMSTLAALAIALLAGAWLALFTFVPFDLTPRVG